MPRVGLCALMFFALVGETSAATVEPKVKLLVREKPSAAARIVDRVPAGRKLPLIGKNADGSWAQIDTGKRAGWVPSAQLKGGRPAPKARAADDDEVEKVQRPLAQRRNVRAEAWVSQSRYHDEENNRLTVSVVRAELYGRPAAGGTVVGTARRGDVVALVRRSADRKWLLIDIGGGEVAWIEAKNARSGVAREAATGIEEEAPPPPPPVKLSKKERELAERERELVERERELEERATAREQEKAEKAEFAKKDKLTKKAEKTRKAEEERLAAEEAERARRERSEDEAPPIIAEKKGKKKKLIASRDDSGVAMAARAERGSTTLVATPPGGGSGSNFFGVGARAGFAVLSQRFTSNGTGALTNYESGTTALGVQVGAAYTRAFRSIGRFGLDASYSFAGAAGVRHQLADGGTLILGVQSHTIDGGASAGVHFDKIGGIELRARLGAQLGLNLIQGHAKAPLPSDRVVGMTVGLSLAAPNLITLAQRPLGAHLYAMAIAPAQRDQTIGLEDGIKSSTFGAAFGGGVCYGLYKGLSLEGAYSYAFVLTHYEGQARRNTTITSADRGSAQHLITFGLAYNY